MELPLGQGKKILIVDDDLNHVLLLEKRLKAAGYQTMAASDGIEGLEQAIHQRPDLIITDVLLPKMNGFQLIEQLKSNPETSTIPVIMMSAVYVTEEDMARGFELGAETYMTKADLALRKPLQEEALLKATTSLLGRGGEKEEKEEKVETAPPARLLVVDDDPEAVLLIVKRLQPEGYIIDTAADGQEALEKVFSAPFDLILLDIKLPKVDGLEVLSQVKDRHPGIAVVMMTAYGSEKIAAEALRRGADDYIIKPIDEVELEPTVREVLDRMNRRQQVEQIANRLRSAASPELEDKERLIEELRHSSITLMEQYNRLLVAEEQNRIYAERLEQMVEERTRDLKRRSQELSILHSVLSAATRTLELPQVLDITLKELEKVISADATAAFVLDQETDRLRLGAQHNMPAEFLRWMSRTPGGEGVFAEVLESGKGRLVVDITTEPSLSAFFKSVSRTPCMVVFPMKSPREVVGLVLGICSAQHEFDESSWKLLDSIGDELGVVVENVRLYDNLSLAYLSTIRALAEAVDARDAYTKGHSDKVSAYAVAIAKRMGLDKEMVLAVRYAGYLHDIGKIGTPDAVLLKEGLLDLEEMSTMKLHPGTGHKILEHARIPEEIKKMIRHHHERYNGSGYPDGLAGEDIPIGSRILCVADAYEAMTSDRPYRSALSREEALAELKRHCGDQFDPQIVEVFLEIREEVDRGMQENGFVTEA